MGTPGHPRIRPHLPSCSLLSSATGRSLHFVPSLPCFPRSLWCREVSSNPALGHRVLLLLDRALPSPLSRHLPTRVQHTHGARAEKPKQLLTMSTMSAWWNPSPCGSATQSHAAPAHPPRVSGRETCFHHCILPDLPGRRTRSPAYHHHQTCSERKRNRPTSFVFAHGSFYFRWRRHEESAMFEIPCMDSVSSFPGVMFFM